MHNSKLLDLLQYIQPEEIRSYLKFLRSPFYVNNDFPERLFLYIHKCYPEYSSPMLSKENAFKKIFPKEKYNAHKMRKLMHELKRLTEEYLVAKQVQSDDFRKQQLLLSEYKNRNMYSHFQKTTNNLIREAEALPYRNISIYNNLHLLHEDFYDHPQTVKEKENISFLLKAIENLDYYYLLQKQRYDFALTWVKKLFNITTIPRSFRRNTETIKTVPLFQLYELINQLHATPANDELFNKVERIFKKRIDQLARKDQVEILQILTNHLSNQYNKGRKKLQPKLFQMFQFGLARHLFVQNKQIDPLLFSNITTTGILEKQFAWVAQFIEQYKTYLPGSLRAATVCMSEALLSLHTRQYQRTIELLKSHNFSDVFLVLRSKSILLRTYFELFVQDKSYFDLLVAQIETFKKHLKRHQTISEAKQQTYLHFLSFTQKLAKQHYKGKIDYSLYDQIEACNSVILKNWLLSQCEFLLKQQKKLP